ncbi:hypothetical protein IJI55_01525 [Candidatus Saccharibacteria bacterium]|nr:hypothetical protein [Candidatus Saccharibacteria bacterium]
MSKVKLLKEYQYYISHQDELAKKYSGLYAVIIDDHVIGAYKSEDEAIDETTKTHKLGTFMVQLVDSSKNNHLQQLYYFRKV